MSPSASRPRVVVIGVGNSFRGDDGAGPEVARRVRALTRRGVEVSEHDGGVADLLEAWNEADLVVVVDAVSSRGSAPGEVYRLEVHQTSDLTPGRTVSSHLVSAGEAVELARALGRLPARLVLYGIVGERFTFGRGLSPPVEAVIPEVTVRVMEELGEEVQHRQPDPG